MNNTISEKQLIANRENALKGWVKTLEGKKTVSYNAITHWITSERVLGDEKPLFEKIKEELYKDLQPKGYVEQLLVERIAFHQMKLMRVASMEKIYIDTEPYRVLIKDLMAEKEKLKKPDPQLILLHPNIEEGRILEEDEVQDESLQHYLKAKAEYEEQCRLYDEEMAKIDKLIASLEHSLNRKALNHRSITYDVDQLELYQRYETAIENRLFRAIHELLHYKKHKRESLYGYSNRNGFVL